MITEQDIADAVRQATGETGEIEITIHESGMHGGWIARNTVRGSWSVGTQGLYIGTNNILVRHDGTPIKEPTDDAMADLYGSLQDIDRQWSGIKAFLDEFINRDDAGFLREARDLVPGLVTNVGRLLLAMDDVIRDDESMIRPMTPKEVRQAEEEDAQDTNPIRREALDNDPENHRDY